MSGIQGIEMELLQELESLKPTSHRKIIELVEEAGIDVSDWSNFKGGPEKASMNPSIAMSGHLKTNQKT